MAKRVLLSIPEKLFHRIKSEQEEFSYSNVQEVIINSVREHFFPRTSTSSGGKRGRPKKVDITAVVNRKHIFSKRGKGAKLVWS
jgi:hypothetical protein